MELLTLALRWINLSQTSQTNNHSEVIVRSTPTFSRMISKPSRQQASTLLTMSKTLNHWILISCRALIWADSDLHRDGSWPTGTITVPEQPTLPLFVVIAAAIPVKEYWNPTRHVLQFLRYHEASSHFLVFQILPHHFFFSPSQHTAVTFSSNINQANRAAAQQMLGRLYYSCTLCWRNISEHLRKYWVVH